MVAALLHDRVPASVLRDAQLVASELVSNSLCHSCPRASVVVVRAQLTGTMVRLEVADGGRDGVIAPRPPDLQGGGGMGLNVVQALSERWGLERVPASGSRVWAQLPRTPRTASAAAQASGDELAARAARNGGRTSGRGAPRRRSAEGTP